MDRKQNGMTMIGFLITLSVAMLFIYCGMKIVPMYTEYYSVKKALARLEGRNQLPALRRDLAEEKAVELLVERTKAITVAAAKKAKGVWTPSKEEQAENPGLWTTGR